MSPRRVDTPYRELPLSLIDEPALAMRETFDPAMMDDLTSSIQELGILQPIIVEQRGGRYEIQDGHRRFLCAVRAGLKSIPSVVRNPEQISGEAVKVHANTYREDVNPGEEARYLAQLLERDCDGDVDRLCKLTRQSRNYVEGRLLLLAGDPDVFAALRARRLSMAVARELNKVSDRGYRMMYLDAAIRGGATSRMVQEWRTTSDSMTPVDPGDPGTGANQYTGMPAPVTTMTCTCCDSSEEPWAMELLPVHRRCRGMFLDPLIARLRGRMGGGADEGETLGASVARTT